LLHLLPELAQARQPVLRRIAGDQAGVDGADRGADTCPGSDLAIDLNFEELMS
jgi:hypothetical protein